MDEIKRNEKKRKIKAKINSTRPKYGAKYIRESWLTDYNFSF